MRYRLILDPGLCCANCLYYQDKDNPKPLRCETEKGCPISDVAPSQGNEKIIQAFIRAKKVQMRTQIADLSRPILESVGLNEDLDLLEMLEDVWSDFLNYRRGRK